MKDLKELFESTLKLDEKKDNHVFFSYGDGVLKWRTSDGRTGSDPMKKKPSKADLEKKASKMFGGKDHTMEIREADDGLRFKPGTELTVDMDGEDVVVTVIKADEKGERVQVKTSDGKAWYPMSAVKESVLDHS